MSCLHNAAGLHSPQWVSIKKQQDFKRVYSRGKYAADELLVAYALHNGLNHNRIGITVSKKVGCAVVRNQVKRWIRESYRLSSYPHVRRGQANDCNDCFDFVVIARAPAGQLAGKGAYSVVDTSVKRLLSKVGKKMGFTL